MDNNIAITMRLIPLLIRFIEAAHVKTSPYRW